MAWRVLPLLTITLLASLSAGGVGFAQDTKPVKTIKKGSGQFEEHYEILPPEGPDPIPNASGGANLDPEGGAPSPSRGAGPSSGKATPLPAASHKGPLFGAPPRKQREPEAPEPPASPTAYPEPERIAEPPSPAAPKKTAKQQDVPSERDLATPNRSPRLPPATVATSETSDGLDATFFYKALDEGGEWSDHAVYGRVFVPTVDERWRPYTRGRWAYSDGYGWVWVSQEPFGWATFHYGRWTKDDGRWIWIPGADWAPSWVVWRQGEDAIGWAPMPPSARFTNKGLSVDADAIESEGFMDAWVFVDPRYFGQPGMTKYLRQPSWNRDLVSRTASRVGYQRDSGRIANRGLAPEDIERLAGKKIDRVQVTLSPEQRWKFGGSDATTVKLYRPDSPRVSEGSVNAEGVEKKQRKSSAPKAVTKFAPQPVLQRVETESGVTETWVTPDQTPPSANQAAHNLDKSEAKAPNHDKIEKKFTPATVERTDTGGAVTETWSSPPIPAAPSKAAARSDPESAKTQGPRYEKYSAPPPDGTVDDQASPPAKKKATSTTETGSTMGTTTAAEPKPKLRWDGSGASGGPNMVPGSVQ